MRVLVPRRIIGLGVLLVLLCLTPAISPPAFARPSPWVDKEDPNPPPKGDGDGTVVKATSGSQSPGYVRSTPVSSGTRMSVSSMISSALRLMSMGYGVRWYL